MSAGCGMIVLLPPADERILGAKHSRLPRTRPQQEKVGSRGREDYPQAKPSMPPQPPLAPVLRLASRVALGYPFRSRPRPSPTSDVGVMAGRASQGHRNSISQSSNVARVVLSLNASSPPPLAVRLHVQSISFIAVSAT